MKILSCITKALPRDEVEVSFTDLALKETEPVTMNSCVAVVLGESLLRDSGLVHNPEIQVRVRRILEGALDPDAAFMLVEHLMEAHDLWPRMDAQYREADWRQPA